MSKIPLVSSGSEDLFVLVDEHFLGILSNFTWYLNHEGYAATKDETGDDVLMHRLIMGVLDKPSVEVVHENSDKLDNRLSNLTITELLVIKSGTSEYRGVSRVVPGERWKASGTLDGRTYYLGLFDTELEAAQYAAAWRRTHKAQYTEDDEELASAFPNPIPLKPKCGRQKLRVKTNINSYTVFVYDKGMGNKASLYIATLPKEVYSFEDALNLQKVCQLAWDRKDFDYVNSVRAQHGTF